MDIYVASSWRNEQQPKVVSALRNAGHEVYDFRHAGPCNQGFHWSEIDASWKDWTPWQFAHALDHPLARDGFERDKTAIEESDAIVLVMPCGRSAHLELGYAIGLGKRSAILLADGEPELMYRAADELCCSLAQLLAWAEQTTEELGDDSPI